MHCSHLQSGLKPKCSNGNLLLCIRSLTRSWLSLSLWVIALNVAVARLRIWIATLLLVFFPTWWVAVVAVKLLYGVFKKQTNKQKKPLRFFFYVKTHGSGQCSADCWRCVLQTMMLMFCLVDSHSNCSNWVTEKCSFQESQSAIKIMEQCLKGLFQPIVCSLRSQVCYC